MWNAGLARYRLDAGSGEDMNCGNCGSHDDDDDVIVEVCFFGASEKFIVDQTDSKVRSLRGVLLIGTGLGAGLE